MHVKNAIGTQQNVRL